MLTIKNRGSSAAMLGAPGGGRAGPPMAIEGSGRRRRRVMWSILSGEVNASAATAV
jgi:hypothetical protein